jgi:molybdate transport system substrate-binding protein
VKTVAIAPARLHSPIVYPIAVLKRSQHPKAARDYIEFLKQAPARAIFKQYGFGVI